jgi:hypothetical protein
VNARVVTTNAFLARLDQRVREDRTMPNNVEAEQALLGAILVNNEAFHHVADFLEPGHFFEDLHRRIYETAASLIKAGKVATPITLRTYLGDADLGGLTVSEYLARTAREATTVINAADYGRTIHDLAIRRQLVAIGEDIASAAYDAPVEAVPADQIAAAEQRLSEARAAAAASGNGARPNGLRRPSRLSQVNVVAWAHTEPPPLEFAIDRLLPRGMVTLLAGDGGAGKSLLLQTMMTCVAGGLPFMGFSTVQGAAAGLFGEDPEAVLLGAIDAASKNGGPWSVYPQAKRDGRFAAERIARQFGINAETAERPLLPPSCTRDWPQITPKNFTLKPSTIFPAEGASDAQA